MDAGVYPTSTRSRRRGAPLLKSRICFSASSGNRKRPHRRLVVCATQHRRKRNPTKKPPEAPGRTTYRRRTPHTAAIRQTTQHHDLGETMLRAKSLPEFLEQANTDGMRATMLLQADGALQGAAGKGITALHGQIMGVVSTAMWGEFDGAEMESGTGDLDMILMGMDTGTLGVARLRTGHLVCVYAEDWVQLGSVRTRLLSLRSALEISLRSLEEG